MIYHREVGFGHNLEQQNSAVQSVECLYQRYRRAILLHLMRLVGEMETAEDLCQETFLKAWRGWAQRDSTASAAAWLYRIATNTAYDHLRRRRRVAFMPLSIAEHTPHDGKPMEMCVDEGEPVLAALAQLPESYRVPLMLQVYAGYSTRDISQALGSTDSAIKTRLCRARARFRKAYGER
jgi:RNA polymerase sigma-70 factor (ECF subfamily)